MNPESSKKSCVDRRQTLTAKTVGNDVFLNSPHENCIWIKNWREVKKMEENQTFYFIQIELEHCMFALLVPALNAFLLRVLPQEDRVIEARNLDTEYLVRKIEAQRDLVRPNPRLPSNSYDSSIASALEWTLLANDAVKHFKKIYLLKYWKKYMKAFKTVCKWMENEDASRKINIKKNSMMNVY